MLAWLQNLPRPAPKNITIRVKKTAERHLRHGHPWLFDQAVANQSGEGAAGDLVVAFDEKRGFLALGLYDPHSPIRVKVLHSKKPIAIDDAFFAGRIHAAIARREALQGTDTDGYRVVHGENDGLPGLVVDRYHDTLVIKLYSACWVPRLHQVVPALVAALAPTRIVLRLSRGVAKHPAELAGLSDGVVVAGPPLDGPILFHERGLVFEADPIAGQKTGFFLDQRDNRAIVESLSAGKRVLNVFSYSGGFSVAAARGGARHVVSVDLSRPALDAARRTFDHNRHHVAVAACDHLVMPGDAFDVLKDLARSEPFDIVVIDPPSFAKSATEVDGALAAYARLTALGTDVTADDGLLVLASCSSRVDAAMFRSNAMQAALQHGRPLTVVDETAHAVDHPIGFAEGTYLKCLYCRPAPRR